MYTGKIKITKYYYNEKLDAFVRSDDEILSNMKKILESKDNEIEQLKTIIKDTKEDIDRHNDPTIPYYKDNELCDWMEIEDNFHRRIEQSNYNKKY
jgi:esterase/lipase